MRARLAVLLLLVAVSIHADPLIDRLGASADALRAHEYAKALKIADGVLDVMMAKLGPGEAETRWFAMALTYKAVALAGVGREKEAIWQWQMAQNLYPAVAQIDMSAYGAPSEVLKRHLFGPAPAKDASRDREAAAEHKVANPHVLRRVDPVYPDGAKAFHVKGNVTVESQIDPEGKVREIRLVRGLASPTVNYAAMDAVRQWTFRPGTLDGQPVPVVLNLTMSFR
jgi:TonB family protein